MATTGAPNQKYVATDKPDLVSGKYSSHTHSFSLTKDDMPTVVENTENFSDNFQIVCASVAGDKPDYFRQAIKMWNYIKGKADAVYAALSHTHTVATSSSAGFMPKLNNDANRFLNGVGEFASVPNPDGDLTVGNVSMVLRSVSFNDVTLTLNKGIQFINLKVDGKATQIYLPRANTIGSGAVYATSTTNEDVKAFDIQKASIDLGYSGSEDSVNSTLYIKAFGLYNTMTKCNAIFTPVSGISYACAGHAGDDRLYSSTSAHNPMIFFLISSI